MTKDLDVFIESSPSNAQAVFGALAAFGAPSSGFTVEDFSDGRTGARFGNPPICFDIRHRLDGIDFDTAYTNSIPFLIDGDLPARYTSADDFIINKLASGRLQDLADVDAVRNRRRAIKERSS